VRLIMLRIYHQTEPATKDWRRWAILAVASALAGGVSRGLSAALLMDPTHFELELFVFVTCAAIAAGATTAFGTYPPAYYCSLVSTMLPGVVWSAFRGTPLHWTYVIFGLLRIAIMAMLVPSLSKILVNALRLQFENLALANDLRQSKKLIQVSASWSKATDDKMTPEQLFSNSSVLRAHFMADGFKPETIATNMPVNGGILMFRGSDAKDRTTILMLQGTLAQGESNQRILTPTALLLFYVADAKTPDIYRLPPGSF